MVDVISPHASELGERTGCSVGIASLSGVEVVYLARFNASQLMDISIQVGSRLPAHLLAIGRAQLAWINPEEISTYVTSPAYQDHANESDRGAQGLLLDLACIRAEGWAFADGDADDGLSAIAAPVRDCSGKVVAAMNIAGNAATTPLKSFVPDLLRTTAAIREDLHPRHLR